MRLSIYTYACIPKGAKAPSSMPTPQIHKANRTFYTNNPPSYHIYTHTDPRPPRVLVVVRRGRGPHRRHRPGRWGTGDGPDLHDPVAGRLYYYVVLSFKGG